MKRLVCLTALMMTILFLSPAATRAEPQDLPEGFTRIELGAGLSEPTAIAFVGAKKIYVTEKGGAIRVVRENGNLRPKPLHTLHVSQESERGLLGIALDPNFAGNKFIYVYYTTGPGAKKYTGSPENRVSRLKRRVDKPGFKEKILLDHIPSTNGNHNGGDIHFGFDGKLYISVGESGCCKDDAQGLDTLRGKILRINPDGTIPTDNPFYNTPGARKETYVYGLRNPWRTTKRSSNQTFIASDVGEGEWEEINSVQAGANYGWPDFEGPCEYGVAYDDCDPNTVDYGTTTKPIHSYHHTQGSETGNVIAGGVFAENSNYPAPYANAYFYGDTGAGWVHVLTMDNNNNVTGDFQEFDEGVGPDSFGNGPDGNVYAVSYWSGVIYKYVYTP